MLQRLMEPHFSEHLVEAGIDEAGRGCYAGPVVAASVILPADFFHPLLNDSKKLKPKDRYMLREVIEREAISFSYAVVDHNWIDRINILQATYKAMHEAVSKLSVLPSILLVDGNRFKPYPGIKHTCIVGGDGKFASIAAASIIAKTYRDDLMIELHQRYPMYAWDKNKGYGSAAHRKAIETYGLCEYHRKSFAISPVQIKLDL
ncbi:MAG: ribonuclease HII [Chitinophagaceae bacterium]|jgi:ribonuclease HII|nr:ribonuclease HII [Chitinophagaceae bacterium]